MQQLPPGFVVEDAYSELPPGFKVEGGDGQSSGRSFKPFPLGKDGTHDGDTFKVDGRSKRLSGVDAFELKQEGRSLNSDPVPLGEQARARFLPFTLPGSTVTAQGRAAWGRDAVMVERNGRDAGEDLVSEGLALPVPSYMNPAMRDRYMPAQREAIASERGAYAGQYQTPADYRKMGANAPTVGKVVMQPDEAAQWERLVRDPRTTPEQAGAWLSERGQSAENVANLVRFLSRNPEAKANPAFQQRDAEGNPVQAEPRGLFARAMDAVNEGLIDIPAAPFDVSHAIAKPIGEALGVKMADTSPVSDWMRDTYHKAGFGQRDEGSAPRSTLERYGQAFLRGAGSAAIPLGGSLSLGGRLALRAPSLATEASAVRTGVRSALVDAAKSPGATAAMELGSGAGTYMGDEVAHDAAPGNPYASIAGQLVGGLAGGLGAGLAARRLASRPAVEPGRTSEVPGAAAVDRDPVSPRAGEMARAADGREIAIPVDASGHPGVIRTEDGWEALVRVSADGTPSYGPVAGNSALPSRYAAVARELNGDVQGAPSKIAEPAVPPAVQPGDWQRPEAATLYHGTRMQRADTNPNGLGMTFYGESKDVAERYANGAGGRRGAGGTGRVEERPLPADARILDLTTREGQEVLAGLSPVGGRADEWIAGARRGLDEMEASGGDASSLWRLNNNVWQLTKNAEGSAAESINRLSQQLADAGYSGMRFTDDQHPTVAIFDAPPRSARTAAMEAELPRAELLMDAGAVPPSARQRDVIDVTPRQRPLLDDATDMERQRVAERIQPGDVLPVPRGTLSGIEEADRIAAGRFEPIKAPNPANELEARSLPSPADPNRTIPKRGPVDLLTYLRSQGGVRDQGGELRYMGVGNASRDLDFARGEQRFGRLVDEGGMSFDEAAQRAWEAGYFPELPERPTIQQFLDAVDGTARGTERRFLPEDLDEVARFEAAQAQRNDVERANAAGAPMVRDKGGPVSLEDMEANAAPVSAYEEWGENAPDFAGNLRLEGLDAPQKIKRALAQVERVSGGFDAARRGRITQAETERLANELGMTPSQLLSRRKGEALNAEQALAARQILAKSANELVNLAKRIKSGDASESDMVAFRAAILQHTAIQEQVAGMTAEAGRALQQFRQLADARQVKGSVLSGAIRQLGDADNVRAAADVIVENAGDTRRLNDQIKKLAKPNLWDKALEVWYASLLSGPRTHIINVVSNTLTSLGQLPEHVAASGIGAVRKAFPGQANTDRVLMSEVGARTAGWLAGARMGFKQAARTMRTGDTSDMVAKVEARTEEAIPGKVGSIVRFPMRALAAEDELFKAMARQMEIQGLALRRAAQEGLKGKALRDRSADLVENPTSDMVEAAADYGRYLTFQRPLGKAGNSIVAVGRNLPAIKLFVPFIRTPTNLIKFAAERSPAAPLLKEWRDDMRAGGARRDLAIARATVGSAAAMMVVEAAKDGLITGGGPADASARRLLMADGWQPYSIKVGDRYYSYQRLDPFSTTIGTAADYVDLQSHMTDKQSQAVAGTITASMVQNLANKTWLTGMVNLAQFIDDPGPSWGPFWSSIGASATVPALVSQSAQAMDPVQRDAQGIFERIRSRLPVVSEGVPARRDLFGRELVGSNGGGIGSFSPVLMKDRRNDPTINALIDAGVSIGALGRNIGNPSGSGMIKLTAKEYSDYAELSGQLVKPRLDALVSSPEWGKWGKEQRQKEARKAIAGARRDARDSLNLGKPRRGSGNAPLPRGFVVEQLPAGFVLQP